MVKTINFEQFSKLVKHIVKNKYSDDSKYGLLNIKPILNNVPSNYVLCHVLSDAVAIKRETAEFGRYELVVHMRDIDVIIDFFRNVVNEYQWHGDERLINHILSDFDCWPEEFTKVVWLEGDTKHTGRVFTHTPNEYDERHLSVETETRPGIIGGENMLIYFKSNKPESGPRQWVLRDQPHVNTRTQRCSILGNFFICERYLIDINIPNAYNEEDKVITTEIEVTFVDTMTEEQRKQHLADIISDITIKTADGPCASYELCDEEHSYKMH